MEKAALSEDTMKRSKAEADRRVKELKKGKQVPGKPGLRWAYGDYMFGHERERALARRERQARMFSGTGGSKERSVGKFSPAKETRFAGGINARPRKLIKIVQQGRHVEIPYMKYQTAGARAARAFEDSALWTGRRSVFPSRVGRMARRVLRK